MKLIIMTKPIFFVEEDKIIALLSEEGMDSLHLHKPNSSPLYSERLLKLLPDRIYSKIITHEHFYLKNEYNLAGIHIDEHSENIPNGYKGVVGTDCIDLSLLKDLKKKYKYIFLKNVFNDSGDDCANPIFNMQQIKEASKKGLIDKRVYVAVGGLHNIKLAKDLGFGGVVVCEELWNKFDIHNESDFKEIILHFNKLRKAVD